MRNTISVVIFFPVDAHVYKYLQKSVGEKLVTSKNNFFGTIVLDLLSKRDTDIKIVKGELTYCVEISEDYMYRYGIYIDEKIKRKFNSHIDKMFRKELITHVEIQSAKGFRKKQEAIREFLFYYNITEEDIKFETLVKYLDRNIKKFFG